MKLLVCDDDREIVDAIEIYLEQEGFHVYKAYDGEEGLSVLRKNQIHLAIVDIMMPKIDGIHLVKELRNFSTIPVIFLSAVIISDSPAGFHSLAATSSAKHTSFPHS